MNKFKYPEAYQVIREHQLADPYCPPMRYSKPWLVTKRKLLDLANQLRVESVPESLYLEQRRWNPDDEISVVYNPSDRDCEGLVCDDSEIDLDLDEM
jgi:hypothetical protein